MLWCRADFSDKHPAVINVRPEKRAEFPGQRIVMLPRRVLIAMMRRRPGLRGLTVAGAGYFPKVTGHMRRRPDGSEQVIFFYCVIGGGWCVSNHRPGADDPGLSGPRGGVLVQTFGDVALISKCLPRRPAAAGEDSASSRSATKPAVP